MHFEDVARLLRAFGLLLEAGHSLLVIEHNLEVIGAADWIIDLGPEGGADGGQIVACGPPELIMATAVSHTGAALRAGRERAPITTRPARDCPCTGAYALAPPSACAERANTTCASSAWMFRASASPSSPVCRGRASRRSPSTSCFTKGQRRYLESLNAFARQFVQPAARPDVDSITGLPPTVAIEQRASRGGLKSTVATLTEIYHFLRLIYVKLAMQYLSGLRHRHRPAKSGAHRDAARARASADGASSCSRP